MKFKMKPVVIDAIQWGGTNVAELREHFGPFLDWHFEGTSHVIIATLEGAHRADPGDWIIKGVKGEFYPCKPDIFDITYEKLE